MTQDELIAMARQAGFPWAKHPKVLERLERFAGLVAAAEREAGAKVCESEWGTLAEKEAGYMFAAAIRARGEHMNEERIIKFADLVDPQKYTISSPPKCAGGYRMGGHSYYTQFMLLEKPCWLHRKMVKLLLGWEWVDNK